MAAAKPYCPLCSLQSDNQKRFSRDEVNVNLSQLVYQGTARMYPIGCPCLHCAGGSEIPVVTLAHAKLAEKPDGRYWASSTGHRYSRMVDLVGG